LYPYHCSGSEHLCTLFSDIPNLKNKASKIQTPYSRKNPFLKAQETLP
jgi:hypothetical protein